VVLIYFIYLLIDMAVIMLQFSKHLVMNMLMNESKRIIMCMK